MHAMTLVMMIVTRINQCRACSISYSVGNIVVFQHGSALVLWMSIDSEHCDNNCFIIFCWTLHSFGVVFLLGGTQGFRASV